MHRWKLSALAAAALVTVSLTATDAWALTLGRLSVQSRLGEPLRAEVELPQISAAEADTLQASIASPVAFRAQGMEYTAAASQFSLQLLRRPDGSAVLRLSSAQPVTQPFIDLVIDASWSAGQVVRSYTLLLEPPAGSQDAPAPNAPQIGAPVPAPMPESAARSAPPRAVPATPAPAPVQRAPEAAAPLTEITVRSGSTASELAQAHRPAGVSLDQMLVAMLRANPHAFISGNVNRMRAGAVLELPDRAAAQATSIREARQIVAAQSQDFNRYRRQLAAAAPAAAVTAAQRSASGSVEAQVEDRRSGTAAPDKLTLSKGALADERLAREKQAQSQSDRLAELSRNLTELQNVAGAAPAAAGVPAPGVPAPGVTPVSLAAPGATAAEPASAAAPATPAIAEAAPAAADGAASAPAAAAESAPAPTAPAAPQVAAPQPAAPQPAAPRLGDALRANPALPLAGAGLLALLLGFAGYRRHQRRRAQDAATDTVLRDDALLDAGPDTAQTQFDGAVPYSHSQPDTGGEVDPLAEADAYLAYGRDQQAEEVLKEALRTQPERLALHQKLADIHAKRQDRKAFEAVAQTVFALTQGQGAEWLHLAEQGRALDPANTLYQGPGTAQPLAAADDPAVPQRLNPDERALAEPAAAAAAAAALGALAASAAPAASAEPAPTPSPDLELGLDLPTSTSASGSAVPTETPEAPSSSTDFTPIEPIEPLAPMEPMEPMEPIKPLEPIEPIWKQPAAAAALPGLPALSDVPDVPADLPTAADLTLRSDNKADAAPSRAPKTEPTLEAPAFELAKPDATAPGAQPTAPAAGASAKPAAAAPAPAFDFLEFDLGNLSLDLGDIPPADPLRQSSQAAAADPLTTKLALAQEFAAIGDNEGARTLLEEVIDESEGEIKERAQRLLSEIH